MNITKNTESPSIVVQWNEVDDSLPTTYTVTWTSESDLNNVQVNTLIEQSSCKITGLTLDTVYTITVTAANRCGTGPEYSTSVSLTIDASSTTSNKMNSIIIANINSASFTHHISTENPSTTAITSVVLDSTIADSISVMMSSSTTASTSIYSSSSSVMIPSTAVSDSPSVTTSATDVDTISATVAATAKDAASVTTVTRLSIVATTSIDTALFTTTTSIATTSIAVAVTTTATVDSSVATITTSSAIQSTFLSTTSSPMSTTIATIPTSTSESLATTIHTTSVLLSSVPTAGDGSQTDNEVGKFHTDVRNICTYVQ